MKSKLRQLLNEILYFCLTPFGDGFSSRQFPAQLLWKHVIIQKILRINAHVPWPVHWTSQLKAVDRIERGTRCPGMAPNCYIDGRNGIVIGANVRIGPKVNLISMNHTSYDYNRYVQSDSIVIGDNCWLGTNSTILPGVKLQDHVIVAAGAVVTKSCERGDVVLAGVPAKIIKELNSYAENAAQ